MLNKQQVISFDPQKTWSEIQGDSLVFKKVTTRLEVDFLNFSQSYLANKAVLIDRKQYYIKVPEIYEWDENRSVLTMSFCTGNNLECILRNTETHSIGVHILNVLLSFILENNFYWYDFAPRNILINDDTIFFVDFEKGIDTEIKHLMLFLRHHVYEEYSSFLLPHERIISAETVFSKYDGEVDYLIPISDIKMKKIKSVATALGYDASISLVQLLNVQKMIISAEEPYFKNETIIFPRIKLVELLKDKVTNPNVYEIYAKIILETISNK